MANVLIVDDDAGVRVSALRTLARRGHQADAAETGEAALYLAKALRPDIAVIDIRLPGMDGLETARRLRAEYPRLVVIVVSGYPVDDHTAFALNAELFDFLAKPFQWRHLLDRIRHVRVFSPPETSAPTTPQSPRVDPYPEFLGDSAAMRHVFRLMSRIAPSTLHVLVLGETGTGKELVARAIHRTSTRRAGPFVPVNCAAVPSTLFEAEFFGYEPGAFTDAKGRHAGRFEQADHGTLLLDEIGEVPLEAQSKLLRAIERREVTRLGGSHPIQVDVRIVAATNSELDAAVARGAFRRDLLHRLEGATLRLPPLRERGGDVRLLIDHFVAILGQELDGIPGVVSAEAMQALLAYRWLGNIRELENVLRQALLTSIGPVVEFQDLPRSVQDPPFGVEAIDLTRPAGLPLPEGLRLVTEGLERRWIQTALQNCSGNRTETARTLMIDRKTLFEKMLRYGIAYP
jgi:two-component system response regulator AtoC